METTEAPELFLQVTEWGETRTVPFPTFTLPDDRAFFEFCVANADTTLRFERNADGEVRLMPPSGSETGKANGYVLVELALWNRMHGEPGYVFDASSGFKFPNGAIRAPDVAYVEKSRYDVLPLSERELHAPVAPDFVVEVMSPSDRLPRMRAKMEEYKTNSVRLGWLIDRKNRTVYVYRPGTAAETLPDPATVSADPELPGFVLTLERVF
ncbi:MAG: Uma2 family endonuclease [Akkermansiaceae bacterium]|nr:Uma2 family endonuclease [Armatimonadota bacterium]